MDLPKLLEAALVALSTGFLTLTAYFLKDIHNEFKLLKADHQTTKDRVLVLETKVGE